MQSPPLLNIHTDGASRGNPGAAAFAYIIARDGAPDIEEADCLGEMTNNQAEYTALVRALEHALKLGDRHRVVVNSDSELMVKQMKREYKVKNADLLPLFEEASDLARQFQGGVSYHHIRRALNSRADALCNDALDGKRACTPVPALTVGAAGPACMDDEAIAYLRQVAATWLKGKWEPTPSEVWLELRKIVERHGIRLLAADNAPHPLAPSGTIHSS